MIVPETRKDNIASSCRVTVDVNGVEGFEEISRSLFALIDSGTSFGLEKNSLSILKRGAVGEAMPGSPCWQRGLPFGFVRRTVADWRTVKYLPLWCLEDVVVARLVSP